MRKTNNWTITMMNYRSEQNPSSVECLCPIYAHSFDFLGKEDKNNRSLNSPPDL